MKRLEQQALEADRQSVVKLLSSLPDNDVLGQASFRSRLSEIDRQLEAIGKPSPDDFSGSVALLFTGGPVIGSRSVETNFAARITTAFQDLVSKRIATGEIGKLGSRGPLPTHSDSSLAISQMVRGSVGFVLEEVTRNQTLTDSVVKKAIEQIDDLIAKTGGESEEDFEATVESIDDRQLVSLRDFFKALDENAATVRIIESVRELSLDGAAVRRGRQRAEMVEIEEQEREDVEGVLMGLLPESRRFEMELSPGVTIKGSVAASFASDYMKLLHGPDADRLVGKRWRAKMRVREVRERNKPPRSLYTLLGLLRPIEG